MYLITGKTSGKPYQHFAPCLFTKFTLPSCFQLMERKEEETRIFLAPK